MRVFLAMGAMFGLAMAPNSAHAETANVKYNDLDLSSESGQRELDNRIERAAREACGLTAAETGTRLKNRDAVKCVQRVKAKVKAKIAATTEDQAQGG